jgi:hypothetical protein
VERRAVDFVLVVGGAVEREQFGEWVGELGVEQ